MTTQGRRVDAKTREQIIRLAGEFSQRMTARLLRLDRSTVSRVVRESREEEMPDEGRTL
jgi:DNA invertase Pin-like site-specific DNA recombinase